MGTLHVVIEQPRHRSKAACEQHIWDPIEGFLACMLGSSDADISIQCELKAYSLVYQLFLIPETCLLVWLLLCSLGLQINPISFAQQLQL